MKAGIFWSTALAICIATQPVAASVIGFSTLAGANGDPFFSYSQDGFTVQATLGPWGKAFLFGNPVPDIFLDEPAIGQARVDGVITVTGPSFAFGSVDFAECCSGVFDYTLTGVLGNAVQFSFTGLASPLTQAFFTVNSASDLPIDALIIAISPPNTQTNEITFRSLNIDNIVLNTASAVPEPGTLAMFGAALLGVGLLRLRRRSA